MLFLYDCAAAAVECGNMHREFHIFVSDFDTRFTIKGCPETPTREFSSLVEAVRHARAVSAGSDGFVAIYPEGGQPVNRIPLYVRCDS